MSTGVAIVGVAESDEIGSVPEKTALQLQAEAAIGALAQAGLGPRDVDGLLTTGVDAFPTLALGEYLGLAPRYSSSTALGGASSIAHLEEAVHAIRLGLCEVALIAYGETRLSNRRRGVPARLAHADPWLPDWQWERPYGIASAPAAYALAATRHMFEFGTTSEQFAEVAVAARGWAALNPRALRRDPITIGDVLASSWVVYPFHVLDCCLVTDAAAAVVVTSAQRAREIGEPIVEVLGTGTAQTHHLISQMPDLTETPARLSSASAYAEAGVRPKDVDVAELYDSFTYTVIAQLEDVGLCAKGDGGSFVAGGRIAPGGELPLNTSGGGLSYTHPGMFGIFLLVEAVRQLRAECGARQVDGAEVALVNGIGGFLSSSSTAILARVR